MRELITALGRDGNPPLYYLVLHYWMALFGDSELSVRLLSVTFGAALVPAMYASGVSLVGRAAGGISACFAMLAPLHVYYSQQVRMYSLLPLEALAFSMALIGAHRFTSIRRWTLVAVTGALVAWTHNFGVFLLASSPIAWLALGRCTALREFSLSILVAAALYAPWSPVLWRQAHTDVGAFIAPLFAQVNPVLAIPRALLNLSAGYRYPGYLYGLGQAWSAPRVASGWLTTACALALSAFPAPKIRPLLAALASLSLGPLVVALLVSLFGYPIFLLGRYEIAVLPMFALWLTLGMFVAWNVGGRPARAVIAILMASYVLVATLQLRSYFASEPNRTSERIATVLKKYGKAGDVVVTTGLIRAPVEYYLRQLDAPLKVESFPSELAEHPGWYDASVLDAGGDVERDAAVLVASLKVGSTVFLVEHAASRAIDTINARLRRELDGRARHSPESLYAASPDPSAKPTFLIVRYRL